MGPMWQRDWRGGYAVLKRTMGECKKKGIKAFWDVRVISTCEFGCKVEMMISGITGFIPIFAEGPNRLKVGDIVKVECTACPLHRANYQKDFTTYPEFREDRIKKLEP